MAKTQAELSHAIVYSAESEELYVLPIEKIRNCTPKHANDFQKSTLYVTPERGAVQDEFEIIELGSSGEAKRKLEILQNTVISHALVYCITEKNLSVIPVSNIRQFSKSAPKHKENYIEGAEYNIKTNSDKFDSSVNIYGFGDAIEMELLMCQIIDISHALVFFVGEDTFQTISLANIKEFEDRKPKNKHDFQLLKRYEGRRSDEDTYQCTQILALGDFVECSAKIDAYNKFTHAFVLFKKTKVEKFIPIANIKEFKNNIPECISDVDLSKLYSGRIGKGSDYSAVQLVHLGHKSVLQFLNIHGQKRVIKRKFNNSDLSLYDKPATSDASDSTTVESDGNISENGESNEKAKSSQSGKKSFQQRKNILLDDDRDMLNNRIHLKNLNSNLNNAPNRAVSPDDNGSLNNSRTPNRRFAQDISSISSDENEPPNRTAQRTQRMRKRMRKKKEQSSRASRRKRKTVKTDQDIFYELSTDDSSTGSIEDYPMFQRFEEQNNETGNTVEMIHIGYGHKLIYNDWKKEIKHKSRDDQAFVKSFTRHFYGKSILEKCLKLKPFMMVVEGKSRSVIPAEEIDLLKRCLKYWIKTKASYLLKERSMKDILFNVSHVISEEINHQFKEFKKHGGKTKFVSFKVDEPAV